MAEFKQAVLTNKGIALLAKAQAEHATIQISKAVTGNGVYEEIADWLSDGTPRPADIPCWSLAALLSVLPQIYGLKPILDLDECSIQYSGIDLYIIESNPIDTCVNMIIKLHELNLL